MAKIIQIEIPEGLEEEFIKTLRELIETTKVLMLTKIVEKSELSEEDATKISEEIKLEMAKKHEAGD